MTHCRVYCHTCVLICTSAHSYFELKKTGKLNKDAGIRAVATGTTYRRLAGKLYCEVKSLELKSKFQQTLLGFDNRGGCERLETGFVCVVSHKRFVITGDKVAFNSVDRGALKQIE